MMTDRPAVRVLLASFVLAATAFGQTSPAQKPVDQPCSPASKAGAKTGTEKPCTVPAETPKAGEAKTPVETKKPSAAEQFPFPGEAAKPVSPAESAPDAPKPSTGRRSAAEEHPFPTKSPPMSDADSSSSSSSSSSDSSSSDPDRGANPDAPSSAPWADEAASSRSRRKLPKVEKLQSDEERAAEDLSVAKFYEGNGNLTAAYLRTKDAVQVQPDDPETHFALAEIAQKLKKREEAVAEYNTYLKLDPDGTKINAAHKALSQLQ